MTTKNKLIERLLSRPKDFTFDEARRLFAIFGYTESQKGATSGSRVGFYPPKESNEEPYFLHRPHPGKILKPCDIRDIIKHLEKNDLITEYLKKNKMENLRYKGYAGSVEYYEDETGNYYYGTVQGLLRATVTYEGDTIEDLKEDFEAGVDDYLNYCQERNIQPEKPDLWDLTLFMPIELRSRLTCLAERSGESVNAFITRIARREVENASV